MDFVSLLSVNIYNIKTRWTAMVSSSYTAANCCIKLDLESIGSSLRIDRELIWSGVEWSGPAIRSGLDNRHLFILTHHTCL